MNFDRYLKSAWIWSQGKRGWMGLLRLPQKTAYAVNAGCYRPEPRIDKSLIVAAQGHGNRLAKANIDQTAIEVERVPRVLHPEGKTFQESLSF